ncbi:Clp protease N-terminal domain-containing protein, partial [Streptomyces sp. NPDC058964]|uniref:Clp protease N-terminal domain-containing protein n=1 Tax=Streptomyces sp. NPDC058964 TaxID=3346681 RepID=UPI0036B76D55
MAERFTSDASSVVNHANRIAQELRHQALDTGHLLLGLVRAADQNGTAAEIDDLLGVPAPRIRDWLTGALGPGRGVPPEHLPATAEAMAVIAQAPVEARLLGDPAARPVHVLLALIAQDGGSAVDALRANGVDLARVRRRITERAEAGHATPAAPPDLLSGITRDLAAETRPVVGRSSEIDRVVQTLTRHRRNVPLLVGPPGVGKEAVATGVAAAIAEGRVPAALRDRTVRALDLGAVLAVPRHRARGGALVTDLLDEVRAGTGLVLYLSGALTPVHLAEGTTTPLGLFRSVLGAEGGHRPRPGGRARGGGEGGGNTKDA